jgi:hypothetical protein
MLFYGRNNLLTELWVWYALLGEGWQGNADCHNVTNRLIFVVLSEVRKGPFYNQVLQFAIYLLGYPQAGFVTSDRCLKLVPAN